MWGLGYKKTWAHFSNNVWHVLLSTPRLTDVNLEEISK